MRVLVQRVNFAECKVDNRITGKIDKGYLVFVGYCDSDTDAINEKMARKIINLRVFEDSDGKMNKSIKDVNGELLVISQFTLYGDVKDGNRPSFTKSMRQDEARLMYSKFLDLLKGYDIKVEQGIFQADMKILLENDGPCTIEIEL